MKSRLTILTALLCLFVIARGQKNERLLKLRSGVIAIQPGLSTSRIDSLNKRITADKGAFILIQFDGIPSSIQREALLNQGIRLQDYVPDNSYTATVSRSVSGEALTGIKVTGLYQLTPAQKMDSVLSSGLWPVYAVKIKGTVDVWIKFPKSVTAEFVAASIQAMDIEILSREMASYGVLPVRVATNRIFQLAAKPFVE